MALARHGGGGKPVNTSPLALSRRGSNSSGRGGGGGGGNTHRRQFHGPGAAAVAGGRRGRVPITTADRSRSAPGSSSVFATAAGGGGASGRGSRRGGGGASGGTSRPLSAATKVRQIMAKAAELAAYDRGADVWGDTDNDTGMSEHLEHSLTSSRRIHYHPSVHVARQLARAGGSAAGGGSGTRGVRRPPLPAWTRGHPKFGAAAALSATMATAVTPSSTAASATSGWESASDVSSVLPTPRARVSKPLQRKGSKASSKQSVREQVTMRVNKFREMYGLPVEGGGSNTAGGGSDSVSVGTAVTDRTGFTDASEREQHLMKLLTAQAEQQAQLTAQLQTQAQTQAAMQAQLHTMMHHAAMMQTPSGIMMPAAGPVFPGALSHGASGGGVPLPHPIAAPTPATFTGGIALPPAASGGPLACPTVPVSSAAAGGPAAVPTHPAAHVGALPVGGADSGAGPTMMPAPIALPFVSSGGPPAALHVALPPAAYPPAGAVPGAAAAAMSLPPTAAAAATTVLSNARRAGAAGVTSPITPSRSVAATAAAAVSSTDALDTSVDEAEVDELLNWTQGLALGHAPPAV